MHVDDLQHEVMLVRDSGFFDEPWYVRQHRDVAAVGLPPLVHYLRVGWRLGRSPGRAFDAPWYLDNNPDVAASGVNPLLHYLGHGQVEGREIRALSDSSESGGAGVPSPPGAHVRGRVIRKQWLPGARVRRADRPSVLLCAHAGERQLFGGERSFLDLVDAFEKMQVNVVVTLPGAGNREYIERLRERTHGVCVFGYPQWHGDRDVEEALVLVFADIIARHGIDVVHANTIVLPEPVVAARRMQRIAVVHARELVAQDEALCERIGLPAARIVDRVLERSDYIIANSRATARAFAGDREARAIVVCNAVRPDELDLPNPVDGRVRFAIISSNAPKKGVADFIEVARLCNGVVDNAEFLVIGPDTPQVEEWRKSRASGELPSNVRFCGYADSPRDALSQANVVLNLSGFAESFGRTVAEAMAARRPVIAYARGALPELVEDGVTGYLVPYRDVTAVAGCITALCREPERIPALGERGRMRILGDFTPEHLHRQLQAAYDIILSAGSPREKAMTVGTRVPKGTTIVIPVHDAFDHASACIDSVLRHTDLGEARVLLIDDASRDPRIGELLACAARTPGVRMLRNDENLGYTRTANRGLREAAEDDVVLLNSDTIVTPQWLEGLRSTAYGQWDIGTVTAMSDNAGAFSFPQEGRPNPRDAGVCADDQAAAIVQATAGLAPVDVPTGSGFCMYIRRAMVAQIGSFDEEAFPRGYGEENDLCMRAMKAGWRNVVATRSFVYHARSASFGADKDDLLRRGMHVVAERYPDYLGLVRAAFSSEAMRELRRVVEVVVAGLRGASRGSVGQRAR
jgi:GT2 family glycosyltransferase/glycosyltransferase involved in cell wall biosynthesis